MMMTSTGYLWSSGSIQALWAAALVLITGLLAGPMGVLGLACAFAVAHLLRFAVGGHFLYRQRLLPSHLLARTWGAIAWTCVASGCAACLPRGVRLWSGIGLVLAAMLLSGLVITDRKVTFSLVSRAIQKATPFLRLGATRGGIQG
jgi:Na+-driven multidrug efflux pump